MRPIVAIVGRPNVGKSTLYNRLVGGQRSIVHDAPGVTRDRHYADTFLYGREITLVDTGGFDPDSADPMGQGIARHVRAAIEEADVILCVLDGSADATAADRQAVDLLRRSGKPTVFVANKVDTTKQRTDALSLYSLGIDPIHPISAIHGRGLGELGRSIVAGLPCVSPPSEPTQAAVAEAPPDADGAPSVTRDMIPKVALIGRPNAGKSSLFNNLAGTERSLVDERPGTTRDPVDMTVLIGSREYQVIDTAGVRRRSKVDRGVEAASVMRSLRAVERADVVVLLCDATEGIAEQDARLLGLCVDRGRAVVLGLNKSDLLDRAGRAAAAKRALEDLHFASWVKPIELSAKTGQGVPRLMRTVWEAAEHFHRRIPTAELNRFFEGVLERRPPPTSGARAPRIYYVTQARSAPPVFVAKCSHPEAIQESYRRFVANQLRQAFRIEHVPVVVHYRPRNRR